MLTQKLLDNIKKKDYSNRDRYLLDRRRILELKEKAKLQMCLICCETLQPIKLEGGYGWKCGCTAEARDFIFGD